MENKKIHFEIEQKLNEIFDDEPIHKKCFVHKKLVKTITDDVANLYEQLLKKQREADENARLKISFLNNISHEIRTPMNAIIGFSSLLNKENTTNERATHFSKIIQESSITLLNNINDLVEFSNLTSSKNEVIITEFYPNDILNELENEFVEKIDTKNIELKIQQKSIFNRIIQSDKNRLKTTFKRLIDNALKFTKSGYIEVGYEVGNSCIKYYVKDTGIGISNENKKLIFESFMQADNSLSRNFGGLGLGLSIVKENIKLLKGKIAFDSEINKGTSFYLTIPIKQNTVEQKNKEKYNLLIAEDEEMNFLYLETLFEEITTNVTLFHAKNGKEAVKIFTKQQIDLVLMDLKMPIMDGYEATRQIKLIDNNIPIIAQTAFTHDKNKTLQNGFDDFLSKPISEQSLSEKINKYIKIIS